jgi:hypothetical protein
MHEAVAAGLESHSNTRDLLSRPHRFIAPAIEQRKDMIGIRFRRPVTVDDRRRIPPPRPVAGYRRELPE